MTPLACQPLQLDTAVQPAKEQSSYTTPWDMIVGAAGSFVPAASIVAVAVSVAMPHRRLPAGTQE